MRIVSNRIEHGTTSRPHEVILFRGHSGSYYLIDEDLETGDIDMREMSKREATEFRSLVEAA
jgi:hypothetical protein